MADVNTVTRSRLLGGGLLTAGGAGALYAAFSLAGAFGDLARHAPLVALSGIDATGLLAAIGLILIGIVALLPVAEVEPTKRGRAMPAIPPAAKPLMIAAAVCIVASPIASSVVRGVIASRAENEGYARCPRTDWPRKQPDRWALPTSAGHSGCLMGSTTAPKAQ